LAEQAAIARVDEEGTLGPPELRVAHTLAGSVNNRVDRADIAPSMPSASSSGIYTPSTGARGAEPVGRGHSPPSSAEERDRRARLIDSDRSGCVLGEAWMGAARGLRHVVFVAIGTGSGDGILSDGMVVRGAAGIAGAAGWFALNPEWNAAYGLAGCWEAEASGLGVAREAKLPDARAVVAAARSGDERALRVLRRAAHYTAMGVANLISALNPEAVVLGGGLMAGAGDLLLDWIQSDVPPGPSPSRPGVPHQLAQLGEDAGLLGAAARTGRHLNHVRYRVHNTSRTSSTHSYDAGGETLGGRRAVRESIASGGRVYLFGAATRSSP
jgi:glucokinase